jgi:hypothetical protein
MIVTAAISLGVLVALALTVGICWLAVELMGPRGREPGTKGFASARRLGSGLPSAAWAQYLPNDGEQHRTPHTGKFIL